MTDPRLECASCFAAILPALAFVVQSAPVHAADVTQSEVDLALNQVARCGYIDPAAITTGKMAVDVRTAFSPEGDVLSTEVLDKSRMDTDSSYREIAKAALRAIWKCSPFKMPVGKYDMWKVSTFHFDPSATVSQ